MRCPNCGNELDEDNYCDECMQFMDDSDLDCSDDSYGDNESFGFEEVDYDSMINNGDEICLNCTFWSVSPYGASHGMICRKGYPTEGPGDSCFEFSPESHFASYGDSGQYQFNETGRSISNKLYHWKNSR
ncbi:hypothetical protein [Methanobrevibacter sp.]|uniref:hypothetical protein n=1 Tax=Methanobrevibacter sp. TaxID=66852 RepID=UPI0025EBB241|nr:hypothetical protein [Methanobrevibacter sp.]MBQ6511605.1 hypothetical protein [Methanobrevibacter sp.]